MLLIIKVLLISFQVEEELTLLSQVDSLKIEDSTRIDSSLTTEVGSSTTPSGDKENNYPGTKMPRKRPQGKSKKKSETTSSSGNGNEMACTLCNLSFNDKVEFQVSILLLL